MGSAAAALEQPQVLNVMDVKIKSFALHSSCVRCCERLVYASDKLGRMLAIKQLGVISVQVVASMLLFIVI